MEYKFGKCLAEDVVSREKGTVRPGVWTRAEFREYQAADAPTVVVVILHRAACPECRIT